MRSGLINPLFCLPDRKTISLDDVPSHYDRITFEEFIDNVTVLPVMEKSYKNKKTGELFSLFSFIHQDSDPTNDE
jgi:hypothetical protein